ncbi:MAG: sugar O-acetyltransferase [Alistipes sp.]
MTEKEKMVAGEWFNPIDPELAEDRRRATRLTHRLNVTLCDHDEAYRATLRELCPEMKGFIRAPFFCDYGYTISVGEGTFINFDCVFIDLAPIRIGRRCQIAPKVQLLTAHHPFDAAERATSREVGRPITIDDDCWLGGGVIVCPGVHIGARSVIGAGAVVTKDIPADSLAVGNPARILRKLTKTDTPNPPTL